MTTFQTSAAGRAYIKRKEALRLKAYRLVINGIPDKWTIGYGHTGPEVVEGLVWTEQQADDAFDQRLADEFEPSVNRVCSDVPTTQGQFDAMMALDYNIGVGAFAHSSVARFHRGQEYDKAADAFLLFDHYHGQPNDALAARREEEGQAYMDASPARVPASDQPEPVSNVIMTPMGSDPIGQQKTLGVAAPTMAASPLVWWLHVKHGIEMPAEVAMSLLGFVGTALVWFMPHGGKRS